MPFPPQYGYPQTPVYNPPTQFPVQQPVTTRPVPVYHPPTPQPTPAQTPVQQPAQTPVQPTIQRPNNYPVNVATPAPSHGTIHNEGGDGEIHFGYGLHHGADTWHENFPQCGGHSQSPIDIRSHDVEMVYMAPLKFTNYGVTPVTMDLENNGHTMEIGGFWTKGKTPTIEGGPLQGAYEFQQLHFHWGVDDHTGSEHTVNGKRFPLEMHVVHWNTKYDTFQDALHYKDGLAVLGYLFEITHEENPMIEKYIESMGGIQGTQPIEIQIPPMPINNLNLEFERDYVTYQGSLTTPPCFEVVTWLVSIKSLTVSQRQMALLRSIVLDSESNKHMYNYRPFQPLNNRPVYMVVSA